MEFIHPYVRDRVSIHTHWREKLYVHSTYIENRICNKYMRWSRLLNLEEHRDTGSAAEGCDSVIVWGLKCLMNTWRILMIEREFIKKTVDRNLCALVWKRVFADKSKYRSLTYLHVKMIIFEMIIFLAIKPWDLFFVNWNNYLKVPTE